MKLRAITSMVFVSMLLCASGSAQSDLRLMDLNVVAMDDHGRLVTDLTADDFQISDAGKPQKISFFRRNGESSGRNRARASSRDEFSNRAGGGPRNATVILFDLLNLGYGARGFAEKEIVRNLGGLESADSMYLYLLSDRGKFFQVHGVSPGEAPVPQPPGIPWTRQIKQMMDLALRAVMGFRSPDIDVFVRTQLTFAALEALGEQLSAVPGRKIIVWVTDGVPLGLGEMRSDTGFPADFTPQIRQLSEVLERSNIALYPVRQIMLGRSDNIGAESGGAGATGGSGTGLQSVATLDLFADLTGGRRSAGKDIGSAVQQAMNDLNFYYQIGYEVQANNWDNKFHKLRVTSKRKGVRIQAKTGYYAWKAAAGSHTASAFTAIAAAPFDAEEIGLQGTVSANAEEDGSQVVNLRIESQDIALAREGDRYTGHLRIMSVGYLPNGLVQSNPVTPLDIEYTTAERDQALRDGISFAEKLNASQGEIRFRVMVFDRGSNAVGSITIPATAFRQVQR
jgi:VWFA-related protein